jgi:hypothetical protein
MGRKDDEHGWEKEKPISKGGWESDVRGEREREGKKGLPCFGGVVYAMLSAEMLPPPLKNSGLFCMCLLDWILYPRSCSPHPASRHVLQGQDFSPSCSHSLPLSPHLFFFKIENEEKEDRKGGQSEQPDQDTVRSGQFIVV